ncbi:hypothetical protein QW46_17640 [Salmonella enterica]|nr:hypothetical protein [Salmonella enterica]
MNINAINHNAGAIHKVALDIDTVINALEYAENDNEISNKLSSLIKICVNQLKNNLSTLNHESGFDYQENKQ